MNFLVLKMTIHFFPILKNLDKSGLLKLPIEVTSGLENLVSAYSKLFEGSNIGKVVVKV